MQPKPWILARDQDHEKLRRQPCQEQLEPRQRLG